MLTLLYNEDSSAQNISLQYLQSIISAVSVFLSNYSYISITALLSQWILFLLHVDKYTIYYARHKRTLLDCNNIQILYIIFYYANCMHYV